MRKRSLYHHLDLGGGLLLLNETLLLMIPPAGGIVFVSRLSSGSRLDETSELDNNKEG